MESIKKFLARRFWDRSHAAGEYVSWPQEPVVRRCLNRRISGSEDVWPVDWLAREVVVERLPRTLSLGCGDGALERDLMTKGLCETVVGLDISEQALEVARRRAQGEGFAGLSYRHADLDRLDLDGARFDAVFSHQALHHVRELESCLSEVARTLTPDGMLYLDEYVGPSRDQWDRERLAPAEEVYRQLPARMRRRRRLELPVDWRDPSEAVRSSEIVPWVEELFEIRERRDYGGNLLSVIYPHLDFANVSAEDRDALLRELLAREDEILAGGMASFYTVLVAGPRGAAAGNEAGR